MFSMTGSTMQYFRVAGKDLRECDYIDSTLDSGEFIECLVDTRRFKNVTFRHVVFTDCSVDGKFIEHLEIESLAELQEAAR